MNLRRKNQNKTIERNRFKIAGHFEREIRNDIKNKMKAPLYKISEDFGKLIDVYLLKYTFEDEPEMISGIKLVFENGVVFHEALPDTDEITCESNQQFDYDIEICVSNYSA